VASSACHQCAVVAERGEQKSRTERVVERRDERVKIDSAVLLL
jgi:hypothetical protein